MTLAYGFAITTTLIGFFGMVVMGIDLYYRWKKLKEKEKK